MQAGPDPNRQEQRGQDEEDDARHLDLQGPVGAWQVSWSVLHDGTDRR